MQMPPLRLRSANRSSIGNTPSHDRIVLPARAPAYRNLQSGRRGSSNNAVPKRGRRDDASRVPFDCSHFALERVTPAESVWLTELRAQAIMMGRQRHCDYDRGLVQYFHEGDHGGVNGRRVAVAKKVSDLEGK